MDEDIRTRLAASAHLFSSESYSPATDEVSQTTPSQKDGRQPFNQKNKVVKGDLNDIECVVIKAIETELALSCESFQENMKDIPWEELDCDELSLWAIVVSCEQELDVLLPDKEINKTKCPRDLIGCFVTSCSSLSINN